MTRGVYWPVPDFVGDRARVQGDEYRHLIVTRIREGEELELFDGRGTVWTVDVETVSKKDVLCAVRNQRCEPKPVQELWLAQALIRIPAFEEIIEKAVELGVTRIIPFTATRSNVHLKDRLDRWHRIVVEASKQSRHYHLTVIDPIRRFEEVIVMDAPTRILFAEGHGRPLESAVHGSPALYLIGPEGGWTDTELAAALSAGFVDVHLGPHVLRATTAATVATALIGYELQTLQ